MKNEDREYLLRASERMVDVLRGGGSNEEIALCLLEIVLAGTAYCGEEGKRAILQRVIVLPEKPGSVN